MTTDQIFSARGTAAQTALIRSAVDRCNFRFDVLAPGLRDQTGQTAIDVSFARLGAGVGGWASSDGSIQISSDLSADDAQAVFLMEAAHAVDFFWLADPQRKAIYAAFHAAGADSHQWFGSTDYFSQVGEAWTTAFVWATSDLRPDAHNYTHATDAAVAGAVRAVLGGTPVPPPPPPLPVPPPPPPLPPRPPHGGGFLHNLLDRLLGRHRDE